MRLRRIRWWGVLTHISFCALLFQPGTLCVGKMQAQIWLTRGPKWGGNSYCSCAFAFVHTWCFGSPAMWCRLLLINLIINPIASVMVLSEFIFSAVLGLRIINARLISSSVRGELREEKSSWHRLSPWELPAAEDCGPGSAGRCTAPMIIPSLTSRMACGAWSFYLSISVSATTHRGVREVQRTNACREDNNGQGLSKWFSPHKAITPVLWRPHRMSQLKIN